MPPQKTYSTGGQAIATRVSGDPVTNNNGLFYFHSDHLGSSTFMTHGNGHGSEGLKVAYSTKPRCFLAAFTPFGEYRIDPPDPTDDISDRGFTGHKHNDDIGLIYMNARYYVGAIGRFISADTIVPSPSNPQSHNRFSYVLNNPLAFTDPSGHGHCNVGDDCSSQEYDPSDIEHATSEGTYLLNGLPILNPEFAQGFGANNFAFNNPDIYSETSGLHGGIDLGGDFDTVVYSQTVGVVIEINITSGDAEPNIVVQFGDYRITYGHVDAGEGIVAGTEVGIGTPLGTLQDQRTWKIDPETGKQVVDTDNTHLHLVIQKVGNGRVYNPVNFIDPSHLAGIDWGPYTSGENLYSISSFLYGGPNFFSASNTSAIGVVRPPGWVDSTKWLEQNEHKLLP